jgi:hypothetical protein
VAAGECEQAVSGFGFRLWHWADYCYFLWPDVFQVPETIDVPAGFGLNVEAIAHPKLVNVSERSSIRGSVACHRKVSDFAKITRLWIVPETRVSHIEDLFRVNSVRDWALERVTKSRNNQRGKPLVEGR